MRYIQKFEINYPKGDGKYWKIKTYSKEYIELSLEKIGFTSNDMIYNDILKDPFINGKYLNIGFFYILRAKTFMKEDLFLYSTDINQFKGLYVYMGEVKIPKYELNAKKYNI